MISTPKIPSNLQGHPPKEASLWKAAEKLSASNLIGTSGKDKNC